VWRIAETIEAALPGRADAAVGHVELFADVLIRKARVREKESEDLSAAWRQALECRPKGYIEFLVQQGVVDRQFDILAVTEIVGDDQPTPRPQQGVGLVASGGGDPAGEAIGLTD